MAPIWMMAGTCLRMILGGLDLGPRKQPHQLRAFATVRFYVRFAPNFGHSPVNRAIVKAAVHSLPALRAVSDNRQLGEHRSEHLHEYGAVLRPCPVCEDVAQLLPDDVLRPLRSAFEIVDEFVGDALRRPALGCAR